MIRSWRQCVFWRWLSQRKFFVATLKSKSLQYLHFVGLCPHILNSFMLHVMVFDQRFLLLEAFSSSFGMLVLGVTCCWCGRLLLLPLCLYYFSQCQSLQNIYFYFSGLFYCLFTLLSSQSGRFLNSLFYFYFVLLRSFPYGFFYQQVFR